MTGFEKAINEIDGQTLLGFYSKSENFYWIEDGNISYPDYAAVVRALGGLFYSIESAEMRVLDKKIEILSENRAYVFLEYEQDMRLKTGFEFSINGAMTAVMEKEEDGAWRYIHGHTSTKKKRGGEVETNDK
jgi:ketosteroid isomerase-like protein